MTERAAGRDVIPDALRGAALLGILIVNIPYMALSSAEGASGDSVLGSANGIAAGVMVSVFLGKFYLLFSFLFGYSSSYVIRNQPSNRWRWARRCMALIAIGALHFVFLWHGDIVFLYGVFGLLLIPFFFRKERTLTVWMRSIYATFSLLLILIAGLVLLVSSIQSELDQSLVLASPLDDVMQGGSFWEAIGPRVDLWFFGIIGSGILLQGGFAFAAFILGVKLARRKFLAGGLTPRITSRMIGFGIGIGLPVQILLGVIVVLNEQSESGTGGVFLAASSLIFITAPLLSIGYVGFIGRIATSRPQAVAWMVPAGRMSLTTYIAESVVASVLFGPWGFGLFQKLDLWLVLLIAVGIWLFLLGLATLYLRRFRQGPLEWLVHIVSAGAESRAKSAAT